MNVAFYSSPKRKVRPCQTFYVSVGRVMTLFSTKWPLDAPSTSGCYTASTNTEGKQRRGKRRISTMNGGQCEVELISMCTDVLSRKCKHIVIALHSPQEL